ncbi:MAG: hypothetical protein IKY81_04650 [Methanocorpusculum sp.]|nr:hypothetical protein [Methanocorpusculum sp.]
MIRIIFQLILIICILILQIVLSRTKSKIPGLVLPGLMILGYVPFLYAITGGPNILWLIGTLPIVILLLIYCICRRKFRRQNQLEKMQIQDLE